jgi:hypothetical protein
MKGDHIFNDERSCQNTTHKNIIANEKNTKYPRDIEKSWIFIYLLTPNNKGETEKSNSSCIIMTL